MSNRLDKLFAQFQRDWDTQGKSGASGCHSCPYAETYEYTEDLGRFAEAYANRTNYRDGKLVHVGYHARREDLHCQSCFQNWIADLENAGKICTRCHAWITPRNRCITIETRDSETHKLHSRRVVCAACFIGGKNE